MVSLKQINQWLKQTSTIEEDDIMSENIVVLSGKAGKDSIPSQTTGGVSKAFFSLAVSKPPWPVTWIPVNGYGKCAEKMNAMVRKGSFIKLTGELQAWKGDNDVDRFCVVVRWPENIAIEPKYVDQEAQAPTPAAQEEDCPF